MKPTPTVLKSIRDIPECYSKLTQELQKQVTCYDEHKPDHYDHRILALKRWEDCHIIAILSENINIALKKSIKSYPLSITSFSHGPEYNDTDNNTIIYGIKSPSDNRNFLTRRSCFRIIDKLQEGWITEPPDTYYTHCHKEYPADDPHKNDINNWFFFSKRTGFLHDEPNLMCCLLSRFNMARIATCRSTKTHDGKRTAAIHIWVLKKALNQFQDIFDFECSKPKRLRLCFDSSDTTQD